MNNIMAYKAMIKFLDKYYKLTKSDDIASLLSGMMFIGDSENMNTTDSAAWEDWLESIDEAKKATSDKEFQLQLKQ